MSSRHCISALVATASLASVGCVASPVAESGGPEMLATASSALTAVTEQQVCSGKIRIGELINGNLACPTNATWTGTKLFGGNGDVDLKKFCHYEYKGGGNPTSNAALNAIPAANGQPGKEWTKTDCAAVGPMGNTRAIQDAVYGQLDVVHRRQLERPGLVPAGTQAVRVTVLDSKPTSPSSKPGQMRHGLAMGTLISDLACSAGSGCKVAVDYRLVMNLVAMDQKDDDLGGYAGYVNRLAVQTVQAVDTWETANDGSKLILTLPLGIEPRYVEMAGAQVRAAGRALYRALRYARCKGALPIVAAGNEMAGPLPETGPMYPALWAQEPAPANCSAAIIGKPLVYVAHGLKANDEPLRNTRVDGKAEFAAHAEHVMTRVNISAGTTEMVLNTGSSVAAASVSAVAAAVWANNGALTADGVMERIQAEGEDLGEVADFCHTTPCDQITRVSMCRALDPAGNTLGCNPITAHTGTGLQLTAAQLTNIKQLALNDGDGLTINGTQVAPNPYTTPVCSEPITVPVGGTTTPFDELLCPSEHVRENRAAPLVEPQPDPDPCGVCVVSSGGIDVTINARVTTAYPAVLTLLDANGNVVHTEDLASRSTASGRVLRNGMHANETGRVNLDLAGYSFTDATLQWTNVSNSPQSVVTSEVIVQ